MFWKQQFRFKCSTAVNRAPTYFLLGASASLLYTNQGKSIVVPKCVQLKCQIKFKKPQTSTKWSVFWGESCGTEIRQGSKWSRSSRKSATIQKWAILEFIGQDFGIELFHTYKKKNNLEHAFALWGTNCPCFISLSHFFDLSVANLALSPISLFISALFWVLFGKQTTNANRLTTKLFQFTPFCLLNIKLDFHILSWLLFGLLECRAPLLIINFI